MCGCVKTDVALPRAAVFTEHAKFLDNNADVIAKLEQGIIKRRKKDGSWEEVKR